MAQKKKHTYQSVRAALQRKRDIKFDAQGDFIVRKPAPEEEAIDLGNKSWGKIDYLQRVHGKTMLRVGTTAFNAFKGAYQ